MEKKNVVFLTVLAVATLLTAVVGTTFAYFTATITGTSSTDTVTAANLSATYSESSNTITGTNITPGWSGSKTITIAADSGSNVPVPYELRLASMTNSFVQDSHDAYCSNASYTTDETCQQNSAQWITAGPTCNLALNVTKTSGTGTVTQATYSLCSDDTNAVTAPVILASNTGLAAGSSDVYSVEVVFTNAPYTQNDNQGASLSVSFDAVATTVSHSNS